MLTAAANAHLSFIGMRIDESLCAFIYQTQAGDESTIQHALTFSNFRAEPRGIKGASQVDWNEARWVSRVGWNDWNYVGMKQNN